jgi:glycosyltransferase involved in cell wall biosynthesis
MTKLAYFTIWREDSETVGINMKIRDQVKAFANIGCDSYFCVSASESIKMYRFSNNNLHVVKESKLSDNALYSNQVSSFKRKISSIHRLNECLNFFDEFVKKEKFDVIYIRRILPISVKLAKYIKQWNKLGCKIVWEIPTWNSNPKTPYWMILHAQEEMMYFLLRKDISKIIAIYSSAAQKNDVLFINNGVDINSIPVKKIEKHDTINLICLATFSYWHGYDRLLNGLYEYYSSGHKDKDVYIYMVGNGNISELEEIVSNLSLEKYVHFTGVLVGNELTKLFDKMDIAIGNLGFFRQGVFSDTSIKIREYCARGIPFVTALNVNDFPEDYLYIRKVPMDESFINIASIVNYCENLDLLRARDEMRNYAEANLTWEQQLSKVLDSIGEITADKA